MKKVVMIPVLDDQLLEGNETFHIAISTADERVVLARRNASVIITDSDGRVVINQPFSFDQLSSTVLEIGFERESYTVDEVTGLLEVNITSPIPFPGPFEVVLTMTTIDGTAECEEMLQSQSQFLKFTFIEQ